MAIVTAEKIQSTAPLDSLGLLLLIQQESGLPRHRELRYLIYKRTLIVPFAASV
jgi:hypothetical protein